MRVTLVPPWWYMSSSAGLLHAGVEVADHRLGAQDRLTVELHHDPQHAVGGGMGGAEVEDHGLVLGRLHVDVGRVELHPFGQAKDRSRLHG